MRIGQVTQDNYKDYLKLLGVKNPKNLEKLNGKGNENQSNKKCITNMSFEEIEKIMIAHGFEEGMFIRPGETPRREIIDVSDSHKQNVINKMREMVLSMSSGRFISAEQADELAAICKQYRSTISPSDRMATSWTTQQIAGAEEVRLVNYIRSQVPGWQPGQAFDPKILTGSNWGMGFDVKA